MVLVEFQVADGEISKGERVSGEIGDCALVALNGLVVLLLVLVDVAQVVVGVAVARIDLDCLLVGLDCFLLFLLVLVENG